MKTPTIVDFVVKRYEVRETKQIAVRSTQGQNRRVRNTHGRRGVTIMIVCIIIKMPTPNAGFTRRLYSVHAARSQRAHGALEDPTAFLTH